MPRRTSSQFSPPRVGEVRNGRVSSSLPLESPLARPCLDRSSYQDAQNEAQMQILTEDIVETCPLSKSSGASVLCCRLSHISNNT